MIEPDKTRVIWWWVIPLLIGAMLLRMAGPDDLWDQTQPRTISYTTDMIVSGRWLVPLEHGERAATKPPLYNWLAAPIVALTSFCAPWAHKAPSIIAWGITLAALGVSASGMSRESRSALTPHIAAATAILAFASSATIFKLFYLARPDMVLTAALTGTWMCATHLQSAASPRRWVAPVFWLLTALAGMAKGPALLIAPAHALLLALLPPRDRRLPRREAISRMGFWWGVPASLLPLSLWVAAVWRVDPVHVRDVLWGAEIWGRITGTGTEGGGHGLEGLLLGLPLMPFYFLIRFAPWSVFSILGGISVVRWRRGTLEKYGGAERAGAAPIAWSALLQVIVTIGLFSLSSGKRADYLAPALGPAALLATWWLLGAPRVLRHPAFTGVLAALAIGGASISAARDPAAPVPGFGDAILRFARDVEAATRESDAPMMTLWTHPSHVQALLGMSEREDPRRFLELARAGKPFWFVAGRRSTPPHDLESWIQTSKGRNQLISSIELRAESESLPRFGGWPGQVKLYLLTPAAVDDSAAAQSR